MTKTLEEIARGGHDKPEVWVQFIEMEENEHERQAFIDYWGSKQVSAKVRRKLSWPLSKCTDFHGNLESR